MAHRSPCVRRQSTGSKHGARGGGGAGAVNPGADLRGAQGGARAVRTLPGGAGGGAGAQESGGLAGAGGEGRVESCRQNWSGRRQQAAAPSWASLLRLGTAPGEVSLLRASAEPAARESPGGQVCDPNRGAPPDALAGGGCVQAIERGGAGLRSPQALGGVATRFPSARRTGAG